MSKIGRNDPCPCKSGKKYKKCCGGSFSLNKKEIKPITTDSKNAVASLFSKISPHSSNKKIDLSSKDVSSKKQDEQS